MGFLDFLRKQPARDQPVKAAYDRADGGSGRGHYDGFLDLEELNNALRHPQGHTVFDAMYRGDPDCGSALDMSLAPVLSGTWQSEPFKVKGREHEEATSLDLEIEAATYEMLLGDNGMSPRLPGHLREFAPVFIRSGFVFGEKVWRPMDGLVPGRTLLGIDRIELRLPRSINQFFQERGRLSGVTQYLPSGTAGGGSGIPSAEGGSRIGSGGTAGDGLITIPRKDLVYYRVGAEGDNWEGVSLYRRAYKPYMLKDGGERLDAVAQEREALGIPVAYPPASATAEQLDSVEDALAAARAGDQSYILMPGMKAGAGAPEGQGWLIEILGYDRTGSGRDPQPMLSYHSAKIQAAFFQQFMGLGQGGSGGARATAETQSNPFLASVEVLAGLIEDVIRDDIIAPFVAYNWKDAKGLPKIKMGLIDKTSLTQLADFVLKLVQVGALIPDDSLERFLRDRADLPSIEDDAEEKARRRGLVVGVDTSEPTADEKAKQALEFAKAGAAVPPGGAANDDPYGQNAKPDGTRNVKGPGSKGKGSPAGPGAKGSGAPRGPAAE